MYRFVTKPTIHVCFFFQAEDGIRDFHVTGVQTCALPILAEEEGAKLIYGGKRPELPEHLRNGYYLEPTIYVHDNPRSRICQEEIFGPVVTIKIGRAACRERVYTPSDAGNVEKQRRRSSVR